MFEDVIKATKSEDTAARAIAPGLISIGLSSENVGQDGIVSHDFSSFQGVATRHEGSSENVGQDGIVSHVFSSFQGVATRHEGSSENVGQDGVLSHDFSSFLPRVS